MKSSLLAGAALCAVLCDACTALAEIEPRTVQSLIETVDRLTLQVQELERDRERARDQIRALEDRVASLPGAAPTPASEPQERAGPFGAATGQGNLLNPEITAFFDLGGSLSSDGSNGARNRFTLRETELDLRAAVSPVADGVLVVAIGEEVEDPFGDAESSFHFALEEAYLRFHTLPGDLALKAGKFRSTFGRNNLLHTHDLPQVSRPLAVQAFLGPEGLSAVGASLDWIVPNPWDSYIELTTELVNADGESESPLLGGAGTANPAVLGRLKLFQDVGDTGSIELGTSFLHSRTSEDRHAAGYLLGADATYQWRDPRRLDARSLLLQAELLFARSDYDDPLGGIVRDSYLGLYVMGQYQLDARWYAGLRYDYTEFPDLAERRPGDADWGLSAHLSWYLSEALRLRVEYQHLERELLGQSDREDALLLGVTFYIGAHPAHPYWVNR